MNNLIDKARHLPIDDSRQTISVNSLRLPAPERGMPLEMRVTAPVSGRDLPVILLSHGDGPSLYLPSKDGYAPLSNFYAEHGFVVIQPTHANSKVAGLPRNSPGGPLFWRARVGEMKLILDQLHRIEEEMPLLSGRVDHGRVAAVGHSMGGQTVGMLLGARLSDPKDETAHHVDAMEPRIKAGVLLAAPGHGGADLSKFARENYSELNPDFSHLTTRALSVVGDADVNPFLTVRGADWYEDSFKYAPGVEYLLTLIGGKHGLGGIAGFDAKETADEDPDRLAVVQRMTWAYLRSALYDGDTSWVDSCAVLAEHLDGIAHVQRK